MKQYKDRTEADAPRPPVAEDAAVPPVDLSRLAPPENLEGYRLEEITIDGICGVY